MVNPFVIKNATRIKFQADEVYILLDFFHMPQLGYLCCSVVGLL